MSAVFVRNAKPGRYADGGGLYLFVEPSGSKRWIFRATINGKRRDIGLGSASSVSLSEARAKALDSRKLVQQGKDPVRVRQEREVLRRVMDVTFEAAARDCFVDHERSWKNAKHRAQWLSTLEAYVFPKIGSRPVAHIDTAAVLECLTPIWLEKPETARRVRQRIGTVLDWAHAKGYRTGENPCRTVGKALPKQPKSDNHFAAIPYAEVSGFLERLWAGPTSENLKQAFEFLILTAARTGEVIGATWDEIDLETKTWTVAAERMKAGKPHVVPLSDRAVQILERTKEIHSGRGDWVFEGKPGKPFSNMAMLMSLKRAGETFTVHGFRSAFRDWVADCTNTPREVAEAALAHTLKDKVEAAYRRSDLLEKRRILLQTWADYCHSSGKNVVPLARQG